LYLHHGHRWVDFRWQWKVNLILQTINAEQRVRTNKQTTNNVNVISESRLYLFEKERKYKNISMRGMLATIISKKKRAKLQMLDGNCTIYDTLAQRQLL
jgi:hypothetical protein